ncbi:toxin-antitoxin system YwqK family antitoxin [Flagellimonas sp. DF-77]|uniref:toxin-antitoxin system YwqK family antitoxin n=1 Tax=Flagellimonas algarum TaxID=3230298 RepID=UPI003392222F
MSFLRTLVPKMLLCLGLLAKGCTEQGGTSAEEHARRVIPDRQVEESKLVYHPERSQWTWKDHPFSGYAVTYFPDGKPKTRFGVLDGKKQHHVLQWYPDGHLKSSMFYQQGRLHGTKKMWTSDPNHYLVAHYRYSNGRPHGVQFKWYPTGELFKIMNLHHGRESGLQQAFRKNGARYANYEARKGRIFGMKKAKLCYSLVEEQVKNKE